MERFHCGGVTPDHLVDASGQRVQQATLTTQRLRLRPRTMADLDACVDMDLDPAVHRFIDREPPDPTERRAQLRTRIADGTGVHAYAVDQLLRQMIARAEKLGAWDSPSRCFCPDGWSPSEIL